MLSLNHIKRINSLKLKKYRLKHNLFIAEGRKVVLDLIDSKLDTESIVITTNWKDKNEQVDFRGLNLYTVDEEMFQSLSEQQHPDGVLGVFSTHAEVDFIPQKNNWIFILDGIQDPGNLGTIIRTADWFGYENMICSIDTVDQYNSKVVQAAMGSTSRVNCHYMELPSLLNRIDNIPKYRTMLEGEHYNLLQSVEPGLVVMGSESHGIRDEVKKLCKQSIAIPRKGKAESLNVAIATAIIMSTL